MFRWIPYTFVRTVLFFIGGILLGLHAPEFISERLAFLLMGILTACYFLIAGFGRRTRHRFNPGLIALPLVLLSGYIHLGRQTESRNPDHLLHLKEPIHFYKVVMTSYAEEKARSWKMEARVLGVYTDAWQAKEGKIIVYFPKSHFSHPFKYGNVLLIKGHPQELQPPGNPGEFDYGKFLSFKNIFHQHFVRGNDVVKVRHEPPHRVMDYAIRGRVWAEGTLQKFISGEREQAIAAALVLGVTDGLDNELLQAYSATGSMHVLAVSGLHVSIIYFIILWIFSPVRKLPGGPWIVAIISLLILWMYAFVTGLSPSVLRAVTMFSFLAIAKPWAQSTNIYNTLAVSAFCLLLFDPWLIMSVGFQLSYLAVLGIVYLYPRFLNAWEPKHKLTTEIWKLICVSMAAQIATFSLGLLYFHQFPNYFLLSNLLVVPISFGVLILGLLVLGLSFVPVIAWVAGYCLELIIRLLNYIVFSIESFPYSVIENVYVSRFQCLLLMSLILAFIALAEFKRFRYLVVAFAIIVCYAGVAWFHFSREVNVQKLTVYQVPGHSAMDFIDRGQAYFLADSVLAHDLAKIRYHVTPNRLAGGVRKINSWQPASRSLKGGKLITWQGRTILHITGADFQVPEQLSVDWLIIGNNAIDDVAEIAGKIDLEKIVLDSSNSFYFASHFLQEAKLYKLEVYSVLHDGALALTIENLGS